MSKMGGECSVDLNKYKPIDEYNELETKAGELGKKVETLEAKVADLEKRPKTCPACNCPTCPTQTSCDYSKYKTLDEYKKLEEKIKDLEKRPESCPTCPTCATCDYSKYKTLDEYNSILTENTRLTEENKEQRKQINRYTGCNEEGTSCDLGKSYDNISRMYDESKSELNALRNDNQKLNRKVDDLDNSNKLSIGEINALKVDKQNNLKKIDELNAKLQASIEHIGDFKKYIGKWFRIKNRVGEFYVGYTKHSSVTVKNKTISFKKETIYTYKLVLKKCKAASAPLFTVDYGGNLFSVIDGKVYISRFVGDVKNGLNILMEVYDPVKHVKCNNAWKLSNGKIISLCNQSFGWDIPGGPADVKDGVIIQTWVDDDGTDRFYDIVVVRDLENKETYLLQPNKQQKAIKILVLVFTICLFIFVYKVYLIDPLLQQIRFMKSYDNTINEDFDY